MRNKLMRRGNRDTLGLRELIEKLPSNIIGIEIGCYAGESTSMFLESGKFQKLYCIDFWKDGFFEDRGTGEDLFDKIAMQYPDIIIKLKMDCNDILSYFKDMNDINFIYIDGNHTYEQVTIDIINALTLLQNKGIIAGHDYTYKYPGVIKAVNEQLILPDNVFIDTSWLKFLDM